MLFNGLALCLQWTFALSHLRFDLPLRRLEGEKVIGFARHFSLTPLAVWGRGELNRACVSALLFRGDVRSLILVGSNALILLVRPRSHDHSNAWGLCMILQEGRMCRFLLLGRTEHGCGTGTWHNRPVETCFLAQRHFSIRWAAPLLHLSYNMCYLNKDMPETVIFSGELMCYWSKYRPTDCWL